MKVVIVYESMFGATRQVAEAIGSGAARSAEVSVVPLQDALPTLLAAADVLVVGAPTHAHSMSTVASRKEAVAWTKNPDKHLGLDGSDPSLGVRDWLATLPDAEGLCAAFDTRADITRLLAGAASGPIDKLLRRHGRRRVLPPESFLVAKDSSLQPEELRRAVAWGAEIADTALALATAPAGP
jgi:hypothetical protein